MPAEVVSELPKPKNLIIQWEPSKAVIKKQVIDLGVIKADPQDYLNKYGSSLKTYEELPDFVRDMKPPEKLHLACEQNYRTSQVLVGDLEALRLVDLEREGLSEYKNFLNNPSLLNPSNPNPVIYEWDTTYEGFQPSLSDETMFEQILATVQPKNQQRLTLNEARVVMILVNEKKGRRYNEVESEKFLENMCPNKEDWIDVVQFKRALFKNFF